MARSNSEDGERGTENEYLIDGRNRRVGKKVNLRLRQHPAGPIQVGSGSDRETQPTEAR